MIRREAKSLEPKGGDLIQNRSFVRNRIGQDDVKGGKPIGRDEEQSLAEIEDFAHLAAAQFFYSG